MNDIDTSNNSDSLNLIDEDHLHVYLRMKDSYHNYKDLYEILESRTVISKVPEGPNVMRNAKDDMIMRKYTFSKIFGPKTKQLEIFNELVKPKLLKFINGHNSSLLTYGVSSSGKTYTIIGTALEPGVIPRSLECLFGNLPVSANIPTVKPLPFGKVIKLTEKTLEREKQTREKIFHSYLPSNTRNEHINTYCKMQYHLTEDRVIQLENCQHSEVSIWISFAEIYNEHIYDLLQSTGGQKREKLKLGRSNGETYVKNLNLVHVISGLEAYQVLQYGLHHLNYAKTNINNHSSRSHSIFTIWMTQKGSTPDEFHTSHFNFCDLAGAERSKKTLNVGARLKESNNINTSLLVLGRCIAGVRRAQQCSDHKIIPFRESKLTQLFQKALSGYEDISMIVNINPCREHFEETQHVLNFSAVAKDIVVVERPSLIPVKNESFKQFLSTILKSSDSNKQMDIEKYNRVTTISKLDSKEIDPSKKIDIMRNGMNTACDKNYDERNEEILYKLTALKKKLLKTNVKQIKDTNIKDQPKLSIKNPHNLNSGIVCLINANEENIEHDTDTIESDSISKIDEWRKKVELRDSLIAEHHKTISSLKKQIETIKLRYREDIKQLSNQKDSTVQELLRRVKALEVERSILI